MGNRCLLRTAICYMYVRRRWCAYPDYVHTTLRLFRLLKDLEERRIVMVTLHATCFTLTAMTVDRYYAIVHPVSSMAWRSRRASTIVSLFVWAASFLISMPFAMFHGTAEVEDYGRRTYCKVETPTFNPLSEDSQVRRRRKVTRMVAIVVLLFATFWFPIHIFNIYRIMNPNHPRTLVLYILKIFAHTLSYANSCVNAFVYAFMNDAFRKAFSKTFPRCCECCPCLRNSSDQYCEVGGMIDQAVQAVPEEEVNSNHMNGDVELKTFKKKENRNFSITNDTSTSLA
ncbi:hypothetical protein FSP39_021046 [Pinctada imbricata]|uniref:G-protein coupled receptors family 1 profile domain-containing protein n=1 Tax=Pinctada imbricata TaxID=66713 RepID=A0AA88YPB7_PINIB|nr:hypothetical protein FSP39_021046 [Pinctada imbricata]